MECEILGHREDDVGVEVIDEKGLVHTVEVGWDGEVVHFFDKEDYPHDPEDRTEDEQRILFQVQERAKYEAQLEFPEEDILDPMWDPRHVESGLEALNNMSDEWFAEHFREFYEGLNDPAQFVDDPKMDIETAIVYYPFRFRDGEVIDVSTMEIAYQYEDRTGGDHYQATDNFPAEERLTLLLPRMDFKDHITFENDFRDIVNNHIMSQIRDIFRNMGETPPEVYQIEGFGKMDIHGDGVGET